MGLAGCGSARWKPQSYRWFWLLLQNRRRVSRPPSGIVPDGNFDFGILVFVVLVPVMWLGTRFGRALLHAG